MRIWWEGLGSGPEQTTLPFSRLTFGELLSSRSRVRDREAGAGDHSTRNGMRPVEDANIIISLC